MNLRRLLLLALLQVANNAPAEWRAAVQTVNITPDEPMWMAGYAARKGPGEGRSTELHAKVLVLRDGGTNTAAFVTMDLIGVPADLRRDWETAFAGLGIPSANLVLNASHTHSGPMIRLIPAFRPGQAERAAYDRVPAEQEARFVTATRAYRTRVSNGVLTAARLCLARLEPVELLFSQARCGFAMNRRLPTGRGFINSPNPDGPVDHAVPVLQVRRPNRQPVAILFGYACHNTVLSFMNWSGDYAGWAQQNIEADHPGAVAMFMTGCGGDQNPYPRRQPIWAERHGRALANAVAAGLEANPRRIEGHLRTAFERVNLAYAAPPDRAALEIKAQSQDRYDRRHAELLLDYLDAKGSLPTHYPYPVQVLRFGDALTMITLGGEVVVDYALRLKRELTGAPLWVAGYSNDVMGYIPSLRVLREGGYEGGGAMRYVRAVPHPGPWSEEIESIIFETVRRLHQATSK
jgi:neutral ceramidase